MEYSDKLKQYYIPLLQQHGSTFRAVDWGSAQGQQIRFQVLLEVGDVLDASVLDIGCGIGHLVDYLAKTGYQGDYVGIDILQEMIFAARTHHPVWQFQKGNILDSDIRLSAEYVLGSGLFTFSNQAQMEQMIKAMFDKCQKAVAFNSLSNWADKKEPGEFYADPLRTVQFCRQLTPSVVLRHDYMPHDFTIYMYKKPYLK